MANIATGLGIAYITLKGNYENEEKKLEFIKELTGELNDAMSQWYYYDNFYGDKIIADTDNEANDETEFLIDYRGSYRWSSYSHFTSMYESEKILEIFNNKKDKFDEIKIDISYDEYEPGCDFFIIGRRVLITFKKDEEGNLLPPIITQTESGEHEVELWKFVSDHKDNLAEALTNLNSYFTADEFYFILDQLEEDNKEASNE